MKLIKTLCVAALLLLIALLVFPSSEYHFAYFSGILVSVAGFLAVVNSYRTQDQVSARGGIVEKSKNPIKYLVPHVFLGIFFLGLIFVSALGSFGMMS
jgi:hypothetical protein